MQLPPALRPGFVARASRCLPASIQEQASRLPGALAPPIDPGRSTPRVAIIGSGFGGLGMGARLRQAGIESFTIFEKADDVGGTWRDNTYPGAACDVPSHLYSLSFAPKADWTSRYPEQPEIFEYLQGLVGQLGLASHLRLNTEVVSATFDEGSAQDRPWTLRFADGGEERFDVVVSATGQLNRPYVPAITGLETFEGRCFHSARWDHHHDLSDRDVAVIGIGASAIQFVPAIAERVRSLTLFQRSVNYVAPKADPPFSPRARRALAVPPIRRLYRASIWARLDARWMWFTDRSRSGRLLAKTFRTRLEPLVSEDLPAEAVIPSDPLGCKRILISSDWYPAIMRPNVRVVTAPVDHIEADGVVADGEKFRADTLIFGTGFKATGFLTPMTVTGQDGKDLHEEWSDGAEAHLGLTVSGFPNLFLLYGPNTNLGHNSIIFMLERQITYVLTCLRRMTEQSIATLHVRPEAQVASNERLTEELSHTVWSASCHSWYKTASGRITNNWAGTTAKYWARTAYPRWSDFDEVPRKTSAPAPEPADVGV
ncbi:MAG: NAD(P)/FAD-dependent oxidoreductase [Aquihabitans sp.]